MGQWWKYQLYQFSSCWFTFESIQWVFFLGFLLAWLLSSFETSLFFIVDIVDDNNNVFNTADSDDGDDDDKKSVNDWADTVNAVDRDDSNTGDITTSDVVRFFFQPSKPTYRSFFVGVSNIFLLMLFMVSPRNECWAMTAWWQQWWWLHTGSSKSIITSMRWRPHHE